MTQAVRTHSTAAWAAIPILVLLVAAWHHRWVADDAYIDFRVIDNLHHGAGPVWNVGERVEAFTSPVWVAMLWLGNSVLGFVSLGWLAVGLGLIATVVALGLAAHAARMLWSASGRTGSAFPVGLLVIAVLPPMWDFATSGLETGLTFLWLAGCFWALIRLRVSPSAETAHAGWRRLVPGVTPTTTAVLVGLGPLVRPDLGIFSVGFLVVLLLSDLPRRRLARLRLLAWAIALPVAYEVFRMGYFATLVPNTALAKEASASNWTRGWEYLRDFVGPYKLVVPLALIAAYAVAERRDGARLARGPRLVAMATVGCALVHALYITRLGGDFMHARMLLPSLFGVVLPVAVVLPRPGLARTVLALAVVPWAIACAIAFRVPYVDHPASGRFTDERREYVSLSRNPHPITLDDYRELSWAQQGLILRQLAARERALVLRIPAGGPPVVRVNGVPRAGTTTPVIAGFATVGVFGYAAGPRVHVVDQFGLGDPLGSRTRGGRIVFPPGTAAATGPAARRYIVVPARSKAGHEKYLPTEWIAARFAPEGVDRFPGLVLSSAGVAAARRALQCPDIEHLLTAVTAPLTAKRFISNIGDAFGLTTLRFSASPIRASHELCSS